MRQVPTARPLSGTLLVLHRQVAGIMLMLMLVLLGLSSSSVEAAPHPVIFFPGYSLSIMEVTVTDQTSEPDCPASGSYALHYEAAADQNGFDLTCMTNLLALRYDAEADSFSELPGVKARLKDHGSPSCAPFYEPFWQAMEGAGLARNVTLLAACYDWRMAPNVDVIEGSNFMEDTRQLVMRAYEASGGMKVYLSGHSNGPIVAQYFLLHVGADFRDKYIAGFIPYAGNWAGGGVMTALLWQGLSLIDFNFLPSAAKTFEAWPSTYFSAAQPAVFKDIITIIRTPERNYTAQDYDQLWADSGLTLAPILNPKFNGLVTPSMFPEVAVFNFYGSNITTIVGAVLQNFTKGVMYTDLLTALGDINQEYIDNESNKIWDQMKCDSFTNVELPNVNHFQLPNYPQVLNATVTIITGNTPPSLCSASSLLASSLMYLLL